jgi:type IV secretion system protein VirB6
VAEDGVVRSLLLAVDCQSREFAQGGYLALSAPGSPFHAWLTAALVIYVAVLGYRMLFGIGETRFSDLPLTGLKIGAILALVTSWPLFQTLVFDVASKAPIEVARIVTARPIRSARSSWRTINSPWPRPPSARRRGRWPTPMPAAMRRPPRRSGEPATCCS